MTNVPRKDHLSWSQINTYDRCSLRYYYEHELGLRQRPSLTLINGLAGHDGVEQHHTLKIAKGEDPHKDVILDTFSDSFDRRLAETEPGDIGPDEKPGVVKTITAQLLDIYHHDHAPKIQPKMVEMPFTLNIPDEEGAEPLKPIVGRIDLIAHEPDPFSTTRELATIEDNKFVTRDNKKQVDVDMSGQLTLYDIVLTAAGIVTDRLGFRVFVPATKTNPLGKVIPLRRGPEWMSADIRSRLHERFITKARTISKAIRHGIFVPTDDPKVCAYCPVRDRCQQSLVKDEWTALKIRQQQGDPA